MCTQYTIFTIIKKIALNYPKLAAMRFFSKGLKNEYEIAVVNEPSVFEPIKFYCIWNITPVITGFMTYDFIITYVRLGISFDEMVKSPGCCMIGL